MFAVSLLLALLTVPDSLPQPRQFPDRAPAAIVVHRQPAVPLVALRMSILADDPPGYAGSGHLIQHLVYPGLNERVSRVGGQAQIQRTSDALVYTVTGPAVELNYLSSILIETLMVPAAPLDALLRVTRELRDERLAEWETAPGHARALLRAQLFPADISAAGTDRSAARFTADDLPRVWASIYRPERVSVVAVGDVFVSDVEAAFANLPPAPMAEPIEIQRDSVILGPLAPPQTTRAWHAVSYLVEDLEPAAVTVTARLLRNLIAERVPTAQIDAEHWWSHHGQAIAIVGAVPEPGFSALRQAMNTAVSTLQRDLNFLRAVEAATAARHEMLFFARTPNRMAEVIGSFVDREGDPGATERFFDALLAIDDRDVRAVLESIEDQTPARAELPPQVLRPRR